MSKYQALIDALQARPTEGPWSVDKRRALRVRNESDDTITSAGCTDSLRHEWEANAAYIAAANPATIRALLADLERAEKAMAECDFLLEQRGYVAAGPYRAPLVTALAQMAGG